MVDYDTLGYLVQNELSHLSEKFMKVLIEREFKRATGGLTKKKTNRSRNFTNTFFFDKLEGKEFFLRLFL